MNPLRRLLAPLAEGFRKIEDGQRFATLDHDDDLMAVADVVQDNEPVPYIPTRLAGAVAAQARIDQADLMLWELEHEWSVAE